MLCTLIYKGMFSGEIHRMGLRVRDIHVVKHMMEELASCRNSNSITVRVNESELTRVEAVTMMYTPSIEVYELYKLVACTPPREL